MALWFEQCAEQLSRAQIERSHRGVDGAPRQIEELYGLQRQEERYTGQNLVAQADKRKYQQSAYGIYREDIAIEEEQINHSKAHEQHHTPSKAEAEVFALLRLIIVLDKEAQAKEEREDGIHLSGAKKEHGVPYHTVECS